MKRWLCLGLLLTAGHGWAEWRFVGGSTQADFYIEAATIRKDGPRRQVLEMLDLKTPDSRGNRSYLVLSEYDCADQTARILRSACFDGPMGGGSLTDECNTPGAWSRPGDESASMVKLKIVCDP